MAESKQAQYIRKNYTRFPLDLKHELLAEFKEKCKANNTTPTTEIKKFISDKKTDCYKYHSQSFY